MIKRHTPSSMYDHQLRAGRRFLVRDLRKGELHSSYRIYTSAHFQKRIDDGIITDETHDVCIDLWND